MAVLTPSGEFIHANEALIGMLGTVAGANIRAWSMPTTSPSWARRGRTWAMATTRALPRGCGGGHPTAEPYGAGYRSRSCAPPNDARPRSCSNWRFDARSSRRTTSGALDPSRDEFVAAIAADIRVPIGAVLDLTAQAQGDPVDLHRTVRRIESHAREVASIVDDLIISARADKTAPQALGRARRRGSL